MHFIYISKSVIFNHLDKKIFTPDRFVVPAFNRLQFDIFVIENFYCKVVVVFSLVEIIFAVAYIGYGYYIDVYRRGCIHRTVFELQFFIKIHSKLRQTVDSSPYQVLRLQQQYLVFYISLVKTVHYRIEPLSLHIRQRTRLLLQQHTQ